MKKSMVKIIFFLVLMISAFFLARYYGFSPGDWSPERIQTWIKSYGSLAPLLFIFLYTIGPVILFPGSLLTLAGGLAFGPLLGGLYVLIGSNLAANASFFLARFFGREVVEKITKGKAEKIQAFIQREGFYAVLLLRLNPVAPFTLLNYAAGLSPVKWFSYFIATLLGMIPGIFVYVFLGGNLDWKRPSFWMALALLALLSVVPLWYRKRNKKINSLSS